jgi:serine/threonine protein phosphatase 1
MSKLGIVQMNRSKTYVVADLHGRADLLEMALVKIEANAPGKVVFTGDYLDHGPNSREVIERLSAGPTIAGWRWICLKGNHEAIFLQALADRGAVDWWLRAGGGSTLVSYGSEPGEIANPRRVDSRHVEWIKSLRMLYQDKHRLYVHASVNPAVPIDRQSEGRLLWSHYPASMEEGHGKFHVVHGHESVDGGPKLYAGRTNLDTHAVRTGRLVVGVFDDDRAGGPVDLIENIIPKG